ncbi:MAG TPA: glycosyltransferase family protein [Vicinamibacteria bacterium]|nr:glycosyltransferase family protein [Vicinamibacteria bacterium]
MTSFAPLGREPRVVGIVSARMASARYPGKALVPLAGRPLLEVLLERVASCPVLDSVALATSARAENAPLGAIAQRMGISVFRGDDDDVLRRHVDCARHMAADHVVRVTGDNPLTDLETLERLVERHLETGAEYTYVPGDALLMGILPEVIARGALERSWERGEARHRSELVTLYIKEHPREFRIATMDLPPGLYRPRYRLTVDEAEDVRLMQSLFERLAAPGRIVTTREAIALLDAQPELAEINAHLRHKPHNARSVELDASVTPTVGVATKKRRRGAEDAEK